MNILGLSAYYHESAACILVDGQIIAAIAEERLSRIKHDSSFPDQAIDYCLAQANLTSADLDYVVFYEKPLVKFARALMISLEYFPHSLWYFIDSMKNFLTQKLWIKSEISAKLNIDQDNILFVPHHLSHAAAAFFTSPFTEAVFLTLDGVGEWSTGSWGIGREHRLSPIAEIRFPDSIGLFYSAFTAFLGFEVNGGEYKLMGLASYGKPKYVNRVKKVYKQHSDGSILLNLKYFRFHTSNSSMYSQKFAQEFHGLEPADLAASVQSVFEEMIIRLLKQIYPKTQVPNLVFGGGVALNCVLNSKITRLSLFKQVYIFPAAGDDGGAVGAALYIYHQILGFPRKSPIKDVFWGQAYTKLEIQKAIKKLLPKTEKFKITQLKSTLGLVNSVAKQIARGRVVGWFEGRSEFGPRALGHRSIIADPRSKNMRDIVNQKIKFRENFRPFAPAILAEEVNRYFYLPKDDHLMPFMLGAYPAKSITKQVAPAIVHIDGTSRIQLVEASYRGKFRQLLKSFYSLTGVPILLNTSFNLNTQPIVQTPDDAIHTFLSSGIDLLVIEDTIIEKMPTNQYTN